VDQTLADQPYDRYLAYQENYVFFHLPYNRSGSRRVQGRSYWFVWI